MTPASWRRVSLATAMLAVLAAPGGLAAARPVVGASHQVQITDSTFTTTMLVVEVGDTVTWVNADDRPHTVTSTDGAFDSGNLEEGATFSFTFSAPGTYTYLCEYHPEMRATVLVESPSAPAATQAAAPARAPDATPAPDDGAPAGQDASHAAHDGSGAANHPDTAMPAPGRVPPISFLLWGASLVTVGLALAPPRRSSSMADVRRPPGGWRR